MVGRPRKCPYCGESSTRRKGWRHTKAMGDRQIFRCKNCGRKFTPKNQPAGEAVEKTTPSAETVPVAAVPAADEHPVASPATPARADTSSESAKEAVDHPRY